MSIYQKFYSFVEALAEKKHNLGADQIKVALTNVAPVAGNTVLADITEAVYTFCSTRNVVTISSLQTAGVYSLKLTDLILTAGGGSVGPFRYVVLYNDTATNKELIGFGDYGNAITLSDTETFKVSFDVLGAITIN